MPDDECMSARAHDRSWQAEMIREHALNTDLHQLLMSQSRTVIERSRKLLARAEARKPFDASVPLSPAPASRRRVAGTLLP